jgi:hypothetical protein
MGRYWAGRDIHERGYSESWTENCGAVWEATLREGFEGSGRDCIVRVARDDGGTPDMQCERGGRAPLDMTGRGGRGPGKDGQIWTEYVTSIYAKAHFADLADHEMFAYTPI